MTLDPDGSAPDLLGRLWYADPTGDAAVRAIMATAYADDFRVVDHQGNPVFLIKRSVLLEAVVPHLTFTRTRRGRDNIRAHKKERPERSAGTELGPTRTNREERN